MVISSLVINPSSQTKANPPSVRDPALSPILSTSFPSTQPVRKVEGFRPRGPGVIDRVHPGSQPHLTRPIRSPEVGVRHAAPVQIVQGNVKVPRELSLVGFDNARWAQFSDPPLTVVAQPTEAMGQKAAELLLSRLRGEGHANTVIFKPEMIIRRVCG